MDWQVTANIVTALAFFFSICQFVIGMRRQRKKATIDAYSYLETEAYRKLEKYKSDRETITKENNKMGWKEITEALSELEKFSVGVNTDVYDIKVLNRIGGDFFINNFYDHKRIIDIKRSEEDEPYDEFELTCKHLLFYRSCKNYVTKIIFVLVYPIRRMLKV